MGQIVDHRPKNQIGGLGHPAAGYLMAKDLERYRQESQINELQIQEQKRVARQRVAIETAGREELRTGISAEDSRMNEIVSALEPEQRAMIQEWIQDENIPPEWIHARIMEWGDQQDLQKLVGDVKDFTARAEALRQPNEITGQPAAGDDELDAIIEGVNKDPSTLGDADRQLNAFRLRATTLAEATVDRQVSLERMRLILEEAKEAGRGIPPGHPLYEKVMGLETAMHDPYVLEKHPEPKRAREGEMVGKGYHQMLLQLKYYLDPDMQGAALNDRLLDEQQQEAMRLANPEVYESLVRRDPHNPRKTPVSFDEFQKAVRGWEARGGALMPSQAMVPEGDPEAAQATTEAPAAEEAAEGPQSISVLREQDPEKLQRGLRGVAAFDRNLDKEGLSMEEYAAKLIEVAAQYGIEVKDISELVAAMGPDAEKPKAELKGKVQQPSGTELIESKAGGRK